MSLRNHTFHLCPGLHTAAKIAIFSCVVRNRKSDKIATNSCDFSQFFVIVIIAEIAKPQFFLGTFLPPLPLQFSNFTKNCDFSNFSHFFEKLQKSQFLLVILLPPLPLGFSNFNQNYDRSNFSQFLLPLANLDISHTLLCFVSKIGFPTFWIRTQLEFSGFIPNWNQPRIMNQCFFRERFEERNSRLKSGQQNAKSPTEDSQRGVKFVLFRGNPP